MAQDTLSTSLGPFLIRPASRICLPPPCCVCHRVVVVVVPVVVEVCVRGPYIGSSLGTLSITTITLLYDSITHRLPHPSSLISTLSSTLPTARHL
jgi:hypothetical protein